MQNFRVVKRLDARGWPAKCLYGFIAGLLVRMIVAQVAPQSSGILLSESTRSHTRSDLLAREENQPDFRSASKLAGELLHGFEGRTRGAEDFEQLRSLVRKQLRERPQECLEWLSRIDSFALADNSDLEYAAEVIRKAQGDEGALAFALRLDNPTVRDLMVRKLFRSIGETTPESAIDLLRNAPLHIQDEFTAEIAMRWVTKEGQKAVEGLLALHNISEGILYQAFQSWADRDPRAAFQFLVDSDWKAYMKRPEAMGGKFSLLAKFFSTATNLQPGVAVELLRTLPSSDFRDQQIASYVAQLIQQDPKQLQKILAESNQGDQGSIRAIEAAVIEAAPRNPQLAAQLATSIPGEIARTRALCKATENMVKHGHPKVAAEWALKLDDSIGKAAALKTAATLWLRSPQSTPSAALEFATERLKSNDHTLFTLLCSELSQSGQDPGSLFSVLRALPPKTKQVIRDHALHNIPQSARDALR